MGARPRGFAKLITDPADDTILGGVVVGRQATELIGIVALAVRAGCGGSCWPTPCSPIPLWPRRWPLPPAEGCAGSGGEAQALEAGPRTAASSSRASSAATAGRERRASGTARS